MFAPAIKSSRLSVAGFTLVEMMIALVLSSVIFVNAYQVISNLVQYRVRATAANLNKQDALLLRNVLSQIIEKSLSPNSLFYRSDKSQVFQGEQDHLQILSRAYSENFDDPGYRVFKIFTKQGELFTRYQKYDQNYLANDQFETSTGLRVKQLRFAFLVDGHWVDQWNDDKKIPELIRVRVALANNQEISFVRATGRL